MPSWRGRGVPGSIPPQYLHDSELVERVALARRRLAVLARTGRSLETRLLSYRRGAARGVTHVGAMAATATQTPMPALLAQAQTRVAERVAQRSQLQAQLAKIDTLIASLQATNSTSVRTQSVLAGAQRCTEKQVAQVAEFDTEIGERTLAWIRLAGTQPSIIVAEADTRARVQELQAAAGAVAAGTATVGTPIVATALANANEYRGSQAAVAAFFSTNTSEVDDLLERTRETVNALLALRRDLDGMPRLVADITGMARPPQQLIDSALTRGTDASTRVNTRLRAVARAPGLDWFVLDISGPLTDPTFAVLTRTASSAVDGYNAQAARVEAARAQLQAALGGISAPLEQQAPAAGGAAAPLPAPLIPLMATPKPATSVGLPFPSADAGEAGAPAPVLVTAAAPAGAAAPVALRAPSPTGGAALKPENIEEVLMLRKKIQDINKQLKQFDGSHRSILRMTFGGGKTQADLQGLKKKYQRRLERITGAGSGDK